MKKRGVYFYVMILIFISSCQITEKKNSSAMNKCVGIEKEVKGISKGSFDDFGGLDEEWNIACIEKILGKPLKSMPYRISGKSLVEYHFPLEGQATALKCYAQENGDILLVRIEDTKLSGTLTDILEKLGVPEQKNVLTGNHAYAPAEQWIYAAKGLSLYVLDQSENAVMPLMAVSLYSKTTTEKYLQEIGGNDTIIYSDF